MKDKYNGKLKIIIVFSALFLVVVVLLLLIFNESKKSYTVQFDLDGGTLLNGSLEQVVAHGQDAIPPTVVKDGAFLLTWSVPYKSITKDTVIKAVWEYETTAGITYTDSETQNYTEIAGAFKYLQGEVYLGAYFEEKKVLSILDGAFADCTGITKVYLLDGLLFIGNEAFAGCTSLTEIEIPETVIFLGEGVFRDCEALETLILNEGIKEIGSGAFAGCIGLKTLILPKSLEKIAADAFEGCEDLVIKTELTEEEMPEGFEDGWSDNVTVEWGVELEETDHVQDKKTIR